MRVTGFFIVLVLVPIFYGLLSSRTIPRNYFFTLLGFSLFLGATLAVEGSFLSWPMWTGHVRGVTVTLADCIAMSLLLTRPKPFFRLPMRMLFGLHALVIVLSMFFSTLPMASSFVLWEVFVCFLIYAAVAGEVANPQRLKALYTGLACGLIMEAGFVAYQKAHGAIQATGTMFHQNTLAVIVELTVLPLIALLLCGDRRPLTWLGVASGLFVLVNGGSRAGTVLVLVGALLTLILSAIHSVNSRKMLMLWVSIFSIGLSVPFAMKTLSARFQGRSMITDETERKALETAASNMAADHPLGVGANLFVAVSNTQGYAARAGVGWNWSNRAAPVHNAYLLTRAELGWQGLGTFLALLIVPIWVGLRTAFRKPRNRNTDILAGSIAALMTLTIHNFYEWILLSYNCFSLLALNIGIIAAYRRQSLVPNRRRPAEVILPVGKPRDIHGPLLS